MKLTKDEIRRHVFAAYKNSPAKAYSDVRTYVETRKPPPYKLSGDEESAFKEIVWELALQGVISPVGKGVEGLFYGARLTEYGRKCVAQERVLPHDIDGYLTNLRDSMGGEPDEMLLQYVKEALDCFHRNNLQAAVVMLGVAAERSLQILKDVHVELLDEDERQKALKKLNNRNLRTRFDALWKRVQKPGIPEDLQDKLEGDFWGTFQLIRRSRNEAGHFTTVETDKLTVLACLASFPGYVRTLFQLLNHLQIEGSN
jgi:hypothetical protein